MATKKQTAAPDTIAAYIRNAKADPARAIMRARVAARAPTLARIVRRLAGTFYRAAQWSRDTNRNERAAGFQVAAMVRRASAPRDWPDGWNVEIHAGPVAAVCNYAARNLPGSLVVEAGRMDGDARADALDSVTDALIGLATFRGSGRAWLAAWSVYGFGGTMPDPENWTAATVETAWIWDEDAEQEAASQWSPIARRCRAYAIEILAAQWTAEASELTRAPLARARRVAAVARITRRAPVDPFGTDEHAEALRDYGARHVDARGDFTDAHGLDAWQTFQRDEDAREEANPNATRGGSALDNAANGQRAPGEYATDEEFPAEKRARHGQTMPTDAAADDAAMQAAAIDAADALGELFDGAATPDRANASERTYEPLSVD